MTEFTVGVVIPTRGRRDLLLSALGSVMAQTRLPDEVVVVVDGPDADTQSALEREWPVPVRIIVVPDPVGGAEARNIGARACVSEYVALLDDDDEWLPHKLANQTALLEAAGNDRLIVASRVIARSRGKDVVWPTRSLVPTETVADYLFIRRSLFQGSALLQTSTIVASRSLFVDIPFRAGLKQHQEWDWLIRCGASGVLIIQSDDVLSVWNIGTGRPTISSASDWRASLDWIEQLRPDISDEAYASFLLAIIAPAAVEARAYAGVAALAKRAWIARGGTALAWSVLMGSLLFPRPIRHRLRSSLARKAKADRPATETVRILQFVTQLESGGAQRVAIDLCEQLNARGLPGGVWFLYRKGDAFDGALDPNCIVKHKPKVSEIPNFLYHVWELIRSTRPTAVIAHTHYAGAVVGPIAVIARTPRRVMVHHNRPSTYPRVARVIVRSLERVGAFTDVVAVAQDVFEHVPASRARTHLIYNGVDVDALVADVDPHFRRHQLGVPDDGALICSVGRLSSQKNHIALVEAMPYLPIDTHVVLVGEGELKDVLHARARELEVDARLHTVGVKPRSTVLAIVGECDVFVFPSAFEAAPLALLEALCLGAAVVASDIAACREAAADAAKFVDPADSGALAGAIRHLLSDERSRLELQAKAKARGRVFSMTDMVDRYLDVLSVATAPPART